MLNDKWSMMNERRETLRWMMVDGRWVKEDGLWNMEYVLRSGTNKKRAEKLCPFYKL